jgi:hypothetical protein
MWCSMILIIGTLISCNCGDTKSQKSKKAKVSEQYTIELVNKTGEVYKTYRSNKNVRITVSGVTCFYDVETGNYIRITGDVIVTDLKQK